MLRLALALLAEVVADGEAGLAGSFKAGTHRGKTGGDVVLGESEEGGLGCEVCGFDVLGDLVEGLAYPGVVWTHCLGLADFAILLVRWKGFMRSHRSG